MWKGSSEQGWPAQFRKQSWPLRANRMNYGDLNGTSIFDNPSSKYAIFCCPMIVRDCLGQSRPFIFENPSITFGTFLEMPRSCKISNKFWPLSFFIQSQRNCYFLRLFLEVDREFADGICQKRYPRPPPGPSPGRLPRAPCRAAPWPEAAWTPHTWLLKYGMFFLRILNRRRHVEDVGKLLKYGMLFFGEF